MKDKRVHEHMENALLCFLDGDHLCVVNSTFVDIQESQATFIKVDGILLDELKAKELTESNIMTRQKEEYIRHVENFLKAVKKENE